ncbi:helix-turn-helix transcriptional regulator [Paenibacillus kandeliae]|uniref:helix-turn-helix transcriptional regulator n=1 Tax=Paenibacillus kandeliae TaxID=3231269 RepID=UPI00345A4661
MPDALRMEQAVNLGYRETRAFAPVAADGFHSHLHYEIYYFHEGLCTYIVGESIYQLHPGDVLLMHGRTLHRPHPQPGHPYVRSTLHFDPALLSEYVQTSYADKLLLPFEQSGGIRLQLTLQERSDLEVLLEQLSRLSHEPQQGQIPLPFMMKLCDLLALLAECCQRQERPVVREGKEMYAHHIVDYIEQHYMHDVTLEQIADHLHLSRSYASSLFKEWTGMTIFKYLYHRRINQAKLLLQYQHDLPISEISRRSGFKQPAHFSRMFREEVGCSPESYRLRE